MENLGTYFFIAGALFFGIYAYSNKKKVSQSNANKKRVFNPKTPSKTITKNANQEKRSSQKGQVISSNLSSEKTRNTQTDNPPKLDKLDRVIEPKLELQSIGNFKSFDSTVPPGQKVEPQNFDLEKEVEQLQARTGWNHATARAYCEQVIQYHQEIAATDRLKKSN